MTSKSFASRTKPVQANKSNSKVRVVPSPDAIIPQDLPEDIEIVEELPNAGGSVISPNEFSNNTVAEVHLSQVHENPTVSHGPI